MPGSFILALDQGTTGSTALVFDAEQHTLGRAYREIQQIYPKPGWVEHNPEEIFEVTCKVARQAIQNAGITPSEIAGIGLTNQRETTVLWDRTTSKSIYPAIVWQCRRTSDICNRLRKKGLEPEIRRRTGLVLDPYFSATKVMWLLKNVPGVKEAAERNKVAFGTIDTWLIWKLTNGAVHATDYTNASRTLLFDIHEKRWSPKLCKLFNVPPGILPEVRNSSGNFGAAAKEHLGATIPISGVAGDQQAALFGHGSTRPGQAKCTFGTGAFALAFGGKNPLRSKHKLLTTLVCDPAGKPAYGLEGSVFMAGAIVQWLRDGLQIIQHASETETMARSVPCSGGVVLVPAFVGLGAPHWNPDARAAIVGMTRGTNRAHIVRAALESIAFQVLDLITAMQADLPKPLKELRVDGGATANSFLMQFLADLLNLPVVKPPMMEMTAFGAAKLAADSLGLWNDAEKTEIETMRFTPACTSEERKAWKNLWRNAVSRVV